MRTLPPVTSRRARVLARVSALFAASVFVLACKPEGAAPPSPAAPMSGSPTSAAAPAQPSPGSSLGPEPASPRPNASASPSAGPSASADDELASLQILKFAFTSNVRDKEPVDKLDAAKPGQRAYAHVTFRNRTGSAREVDLVFRVNGKERSRVPLEVASSWSYRTWGYVTLRPADTSGEITVTVVDDTGEEIKAARLPIRP